MTPAPPGLIIDVVAYCADLHDPESGVLRILALIRATNPYRGRADIGRVDWGVLDIVVGDGEGAQINLRSDAESRSPEDVVRAAWLDVDWHPDQSSASDAYHRSDSRAKV